MLVLHFIYNIDHCISRLHALRHMSVYYMYICDIHLAGWHIVYKIIIIIYLKSCIHPCVCIRRYIWSHGQRNGINNCEVVCQLRISYVIFCEFFRGACTISGDLSQYSFNMTIHLHLTEIFIAVLSFLVIMFIVDLKLIAFLSCYNYQVNL